MATDKVYFKDVIVAFDIETTSFIDESGNKRAFPYTWTTQVDGLPPTIHRFENDWKDYIDSLVEKYDVDYNNRLVVWVHNLGYEFEFIKWLFDWEDVLCNGSVHNVIRAVTTDGIEFRCTYALSNASLSVVGDMVGVPKMKGDLDYSLPRHGETPLTDEELGYIYNDVIIITEYVRKQLSKKQPNGKPETLRSIPLTKTGYVRRAVRRATLYNTDKEKGQQYRRLIWGDLLLNEDTYLAARAAFSGGYTHANGSIAGETINNVVSYDLSSSYPSSLTQFTYPMSSFTEVHDEMTPELVERLMKNSHCIIDLTITNFESRYNFPTISESKAMNVSKARVDNGRIWAAASARVTVTDVELETLKRCYEFESMIVHRLWMAKRDYLPSPFVEEILRYYGDKTTLKGVEGAEDQYVLAKENVNSIYGMTATDPIRPNIKFDKETRTSVKEPIENLGDLLGDTNADRKRFLYYPWGAWCTAWSRSLLLAAIFDLEDAGCTVLYCDTDSIYVVDDERVAPIIERHNEEITARLMRAAENNTDLGAEAVAPKDKYGNPRQLGIFECETPEPLRGFKTLGAKRYAKMSSDGKFSITVAGLAKNAAQWVEERGGFDAFANNLTVPAGVSGRIVHTYSDEEFLDNVTDYLGTTVTVHQRGFIHLANAPYHLSISDEYDNFITSMNIPGA